MSGQLSSGSSRRGFLRTAGAVVGGAIAAPLLAACQPQVQVVEKEKIVEKQVDRKFTEVRTIGDPNMVNSWGAKEATALYNQDLLAANSSFQVKLEEQPQGWDTKVLSMIKDKNLIWSAQAYTSITTQYQYFKSGMVAPLDDYVKGSKLAWAAKWKDRLLAPVILDALIFDNKFYFVPQRLSIHLAAYRSDYFKAAGYEEFPQTWDELNQALPKVKAKVGGDDVVPFAITKEVFRTLGTMHSTWRPDPFDDRGFLRVRDKEWLELIKMIKSWFDQKLTNFDVMADPDTYWDKGKVALGFNSHSWVRRAQTIWGRNAVTGTLPPRLKKDDPKRSWVHINGGFVFNGAPNPQEGFDWLMAIFGPEGSPAEAFWSKTITSSGIPPWPEMRDKVVKPDKTISELYDSYQALPNSTLLSVKGLAAYPPLQAKIWTWLEKYWRGQISTPEEAMDGAMKEAEAEYQKMMSKDT